jgi:hypothetical protein
MDAHAPKEFRRRAEPLPATADAGTRPGELSAARIVRADLTDWAPG